MALSRLIIENFRNLQAVDQTFDPSFNFIIGDNGSGKTSLLEAIYYLGHTRSFKSSVQNRLIHHDQDHFTLHGKIQENHHQWSVGLQKERNGNTKMKINGEDAKKLADLAELLPIQILSPEGLTLLNGGPSFKRSFLDWGLFHHQQEFFYLWSRIGRLLKQRNAALPIVRHYQELKAWDVELAKMTEQISAWRADYALTLNETLQKSCALFLPEVDIQMNFYQGWEKGVPFVEMLEKNFERDKHLGYTVSGYQRADLRLKVQGQPVEDVLSRGQLKLLMCALKLAQGEHLMHKKKRHCIFLIDDFASELDEKKRTLLAERLQQIASQVFITAIHSQQLQQMAIQTGKTFHIHQGQLHEK